MIEIMVAMAALVIATVAASGLVYYPPGRRIQRIPALPQLLLEKYTRRL